MRARAGHVENEEAHHDRILRFLQEQSLLAGILEEILRTRITLNKVRSIRVSNLSS